jgi:hypothetical protein
MNKLSKALVATISTVFMNSSYAIDYKHDSLNRLISVQYSSTQSINYIYDDVGNIIQAESNLPLYIIKGRLIDKQGKPIAGAMVQVDKRAFEITDMNGYWEIVDLPEGHYNITAEKEGFVFMGKDFEVGNQDWVTTISMPVLSEFKLRIFPKYLRQLAEQGKNFKFTISAVNGGDKVTMGSSVVYVVPENTDLLSIEGLGNVECEDFPNEDNEITCTLPNLAVGEMTNIEVELYLEFDEPLEANPTLRNIAHLYSDNYPYDNAKRFTAIKPYLSVFCKSIPNPIVLGGTLRYECDIELNDNAPEEVAKDVQFMMKLPNELSPEFVSTTTEGHVCDTGNWPILTCSLGDLSIANIDDTSEVTVILETILNEIIMLQLTSSLQVTADNYEGHINDVTTRIDFGGLELDGWYVIDKTNSMKPVLNSIIRVVKKMLETNFAIVDETPFIGIVSFKDKDEIKLEVATDDLEKLLHTIESLEASGGGECPEASAQAVLIATKLLKSDGNLIFFTNGLPYNDAETQDTLEEIKRLIVEKNIKAFSAITRDENCIGNY